MRGRLSRGSTVVVAMACLMAGPTALRAEESIDQRVTIPLPRSSRSADVERLVADVFLPAGFAPFPVVVFSHGRPPDAASRASMKVGIGLAQLRYWLARGDAVVAPIRAGYGRTGGTDLEDGGVRFDDAGRCHGHADYRSVAMASSRSVDATLAWLRTQRWADARHVLLVGQSVGGLATVAAAAGRPDGVVGVVNFAGGTGGNATHAPGHPCDPDRMTRLYGRLGSTTTLPSLWIYARDDRYWGPSAPREWHAAFAGGGSETTFFEASSMTGSDGHELSSRDPATWAPAVDRFLSTIGFDGADEAQTRPLTPDGRP